MYIEILSEAPAMPITRNANPFITSRGTTLPLDRFISRKQRGSAAKEEPKCKPMLGRHEVSVNWTDLSKLRDSELRSKFAELVQISADKHKDELVVYDIQPGFRVGVDDPDSLLDVQKQIVSLVRAAAAPHVDTAPEARLSLTRGRFDVRFYLGKAQPRDFMFGDDRA